MKLLNRIKVKFSILLFVLLLVRCSEKDNAEWEFYTENMELVNSIINDHMGMIHILRNAAEIENPNLDKKYIKRLDTLYLTSSAIFDEIKMVREKFKGDKENKFDEGEFHSLFEVYDSLVNVALKDTNIYHGYIQNCWETPVSIMKYETEGELNLFANQLIATNYWIGYEYLNQLKHPEVEYNKLKVAEVAEKRKLIQGDTFKTKLTLIAYDSVSSNLVEIEQQKVPVIKGIAYFMDTLTTEPGVVKKKGVLQFREKYTGIYRPFPFTIKYQIIEK